MTHAATAILKLPPSLMFKDAEDGTGRPTGSPKVILFSVMKA